MKSVDGRRCTVDGKKRNEIGGGEEMERNPKMEEAMRGKKRLIEIVGRGREKIS